MLSVRRAGMAAVREEEEGPVIRKSNTVPPLVQEEDMVPGAGQKDHRLETKGQSGARLSRSTPGLCVCWVCLWDIVAAPGLSSIHIDLHLSPEGSNKLFSERFQSIEDLLLALECMYPLSQETTVSSARVVEI